MPGGKTAPESCPECGGPMWDNRESKRNPKAPDYVCKRKQQGCEGVVWPPKPGEARARTSPRDGEKRQDEYNNRGGPLPGEEGYGATLRSEHSPAPKVPVSVIDLKKVYIDCLDFVLEQVVPRIEGAWQTEDNGGAIIRMDGAPLVEVKDILSATHTLFIARKP